MVKSLTLDLKVNACAHCKNADKAKLRQHRGNYCKSTFKPYNGHCKNFEAKEVKREVQRFTA